MTIIKHTAFQTFEEVKKKRRGAAGIAVPMLHRKKTLSKISSMEFWTWDYILLHAYAAWCACAAATKLL